MVLSIIEIVIAALVLMKRLAIRRQMRNEGLRSEIVPKHFLVTTAIHSSRYFRYFHSCQYARILLWWSSKEYENNGNCIIYKCFWSLKLCGCIDDNISGSIHKFKKNTKLVF
ncbi:protein NRT1/ PTR FAMILY 5.10 [Trifolium repens]|nr:protein NRT1/ PTR FAMILY 5.10 [Trifolium repens]